MKKALLLLLLTLTTGFVFAQQEPNSPPKTPKDPDMEVVIDQPVTPVNSATDSSKVFSAVEQAPSFPGGMQKFAVYVKKNLRYPQEARKNKVQGKVLLGFIVELDGSLSDIGIVKELSPECNAEALRLIKASPKWTPGFQNGQKVRVQYTVPVNFKL